MRRPSARGTAPWAFAAAPPHTRTTASKVTSARSDGPTSSSSTRAPCPASQAADGELASSSGAFGEVAGDGVDDLGVASLHELLEGLAPHGGIDVEVGQAKDGCELLEHEEDHAV